MGAVLAQRGHDRRSPAAHARLRPVERKLHIGPASTMSADDVLSLQRTAGNQAVQRMVGGGFLRMGSKGPGVVQLQEALIGAGASLSADGSFGPKTKQAVVAYQQSAGLGADGVVGPKTWSALQAGTVKLGAAGGGGKAAGVDPQMATLAGLLASINDLVRKRAAGGEGGGPAELAVEPTAREGWFDDAADWVEEKADAAAGAVADAASSVSDWVEEKVEAATDWVEDKADAAADWAEDKANAAAGAASGAASAVAGAAGAAASAVGESVGNLIGGPVKALADAVGELAEQATPLVKELVAELQQVIAAGGATTGLPVGGLVDKAKAALAELSGGDGEELSGGAGGASLDFKKSAGTTAEFTFDDETFGELRKTLTARTTEIGRALPSVGAILFNGKDGTKLPGDEVVKSAKVSITENITLPVWSKENGPKVQDVQRQEWQRYRGAVAAHEDLHAADDQGIYSKAVAGLIGKTVTDAFADIDTATDAGNKQGPVRDTANPAPSLNPAGVEKV